MPFLSEEALADRYRLIQYHRRGQVGSSQATPPVSYAEQAADAAGLLSHLGVSQAHVVGHSTGANIALQLALDRPEVVQTVALLEPWLTASPSASAFFQQAGPPMEAYGSGEKEAAMAGLISLASGLEWEAARAVIDEYVPRSVAQAIKDADTFCGVDLPAISAWEFGAEDAAAVSQPVLSVLGADSGGSSSRAQPCSAHGSRRSRTSRWRASVTSCRSSARGPSREASRSSLVATHAPRAERTAARSREGAFDDGNQSCQPGRRVAGGSSGVLRSVSEPREA